MAYPVCWIPDLSGDSSLMAKPNYAFAKRQRDLAKKKKKEDKRQRKAGGDSAADAPAPDAARDGEPSTG
jgi:hypothetical protein